MMNLLTRAHNVFWLAMHCKTDDRETLFIAWIHVVFGVSLIATSLGYGSLTPYSAMFEVFAPQFWAGFSFALAAIHFAGAIVETKRTRYILNLMAYRGSSWHFAIIALMMYASNAGITGIAVYSSFSFLMYSRATWGIRSE